MARIHTHYDNLKVSRNAPYEVIRAAYKILSQKYHPDKNLGDKDASRIMAIINTSFEILSDPVKRKEHDFWIAEQENVKKHSSDEKITGVPAAPQQNKAGGIFRHILRNWRLYVLVSLSIWLWSTYKPSAEQIPKKTQSNTAPMHAAYVRPATAPNGSFWPKVGYIGGYQKLNTDGLSTVTIDNSRNKSDFFIKLISLEDTENYPVRYFFVPAFGIFTLQNVTPGSYDVRYRELNSGSLSKSEPFELEEIKTNSGIEFSNITITLYTVNNGNMETYDISELEFLDE